MARQNNCLAISVSVEGDWMFGFNRDEWATLFVWLGIAALIIIALIYI